MNIASVLLHVHAAAIECLETTSKWQDIIQTAIHVHAHVHVRAHVHVHIHVHIHVHVQGGLFTRIWNQDSTSSDTQVSLIWSLMTALRRLS